MMVAKNPNVSFFGFYSATMASYLSFLRTRRCSNRLNYARKNKDVHS